MCERDTVEISVNFFSLQGMLDIASVEWFDPHLTIPSKETVLTYDKDRDLIAKGGDKIRKIHCDLSRICEVEDLVCEWNERQYASQPNHLHLNKLLQYFSLVRYQQNSSDGLISKIHLKATKPGKILHKN